MKPFRFLPLALIASLPFSLPCLAENPFIQTLFTADPAPMVHEGVLYAYVGHDEDNAPDNKYTMKDYRCFSTTDMVNWTDLGPVIDIKKVFSWSGGDANAAQCIFRNGKFYYYVSTANTKAGGGGVAVGVAVGDTPTGPFKDPLGKVLIGSDMTKAATHGWQNLDPTVWIDADGRAFLYWGNNVCYGVELNPDMISLKGAIKSWIQTNKEAFGPDFEEAPWLYKRNDLYYLVYASQFPEFIRYSTSNDPMGPWTYKGTIMQKPAKNGLGTLHPAVCDYNGHSYFFYHTADLPRGGDKRRCVAVEEFTYNPDGTIPEIKATKEGVKPIAKLNPFNKTQAETIAWEAGIKTARSDAVGMYVTDMANGAYIKVRQVDFADKGAAKFLASVAATAEGSAIELRLDSETGPLVGTLKVKPTAAMDKWESQSCPVSGANGVHDLYLKFTGGDSKQLLNFDWWKFE